MQAVSDAAYPILGYEQDESLEGRSPKYLGRDGLADWVLAADSAARTVSISGKDRSAVPMAGHTTANVWWLLDEKGVFVTSTPRITRIATRPG